MGNVCVGPKSGFSSLFRSRSGAPSPSPAAADAITPATADLIPPKPLKIPEPESAIQPEPGIQSAHEPEPELVPPPKPKPKKPHHIRRTSSVAGLQVESILKRKTETLNDIYNIGRKLGQGQFGTTYLCVEKSTGKEFACKSILKRKLTTDEDVEDVRREIQIMHHLTGHPNVISICGAYEDSMAVHVVMELCAGGELFDRIIEKGHYSEKKAAELARVIVGVVEVCHSLGVMHRDLKPENFLFVGREEDAKLKTIDFGLSIFFMPGSSFLCSGA